MLSTYLYWIFSAVIGGVLLEWLDYGETEEIESADKSPKHHLLFAFKNTVMLALVVGFILLSIFTNR